MRLITLLSCLLSFNVFASGGHPMTTISGDEVELSTNGHTFAGRVGDKLVFGDVTGRGHKLGALIIKHGDELLHADFTDNEEGFGGVILGSESETVFKFVKVNRERPSLVVTINGQEFVVVIDADKYEDHHFINPVYATIIDGKLFSFKLEGSKACMKFSLQLVAMILSSYLHH